MPLAWAAADLLWFGDGVVNETPVAAPTQYPAWQSSVTGACALVVTEPTSWAGWVLLTASLLAWRAWRLPKPWRQRLHRWALTYIPDRLWLVWRVWRLSGDPLYAAACQAVRRVAVTPGMNEPEMWGAIGNRMGQVPGMGENVFRHLAALEQLPPQRRLTGHVGNVALELAYFTLKERGR